MIHETDIKRVIEDDDPKIKRLNLLGKACANAQVDSFKTLWYNKLQELGREYGMTEYVMRKLVH